MRVGRRGFAVILAIFAIILFGALALTMAFAAGIETRESGTIKGSSRLLSVAEAGVWTTVATFNWASVMSYLPGQSAMLQTRFDGVGTNIWVTRLDSTCFLVQGVARDGPNVAGTPRFTRRVGVTIEVTRDSLGVFRALRLPNRGWTELF